MPVSTKPIITPAPPVLKAGWAMTVEMPEASRAEVSKGVYNLGIEV